MEIGDIIKFYNNDTTIFIWDDENEDWYEESIKNIDYSINSFLRNIVVFDDDLTVKGFLEQLMPYKKELEYIFCSSLYNMKLGPFFEDLYNDENDENDENNENDGQIDYDQIDYVEIFWVAEIYDNELSEYISFHGIPINDESGIPLSLILTPLHQYKNCKLKINNTHNIITNDEYKNVILTSNNKEMSLYELLDGFLFELSFFGYPENKKQKSEELINNIENLTITDEEELTSIDDFYIEIKNEELESAIKKENYELAEKLKKEINELKNKK